MHEKRLRAKRRLLKLSCCVFWITGIFLLTIGCMASRTPQSIADIIGGCYFFLVAAWDFVKLLKLSS
jgi:hypothetical protein